MSGVVRASSQMAEQRASNTSLATTASDQHRGRAVGRSSRRAAAGELAAPIGDGQQQRSHVVATPSSSRGQHEPDRRAAEAPELAPREDVDHHRAEHADDARRRRRSSPAACQAAAARGTGRPDPASTPRTAVASAGEQRRTPGSRGSATSAAARAPPGTRTAAGPGGTCWPPAPAVRTPAPTIACIGRNAAAESPARSIDSSSRPTQNAPTDSCVSTSITTSGQCGCCGLTRVVVGRQHVARKRRAASCRSSSAA